MARYSIDGEVLTALGDAVRGKVGDTRIEAGDAIFNISYSERTNSILKNYTIEGASSLIMRNYKQSYEDGVSIQGNFYEGKYTNLGTLAGMAIKYGCNKGFNHERAEDLVFDGDTITIWLYSTKNYDNYVRENSYSFTLIGLDENGEIIPDALQEVFNSLTPNQMVDTINNLTAPPTREECKITGYCNYMFYKGSWDWYIKKYGDLVTTEKIQACSSMFRGTQVEEIPFDIDMYPHYMYGDLDGIFYEAKNLKKVPKIINLIPYYLGEMCYSCYNLKEFPEEVYSTWDWSSFEAGYSSAGDMDRMFYSCYSLRKYPVGLLHINPKSNYMRAFYNYMVGNCVSLDEIKDVPVYTEPTWTSNAFSSTAYNAYRLKNFTFKTQDGVPYTAKWKSQTFSLDTAGYSGTVNNKNTILNYNSGITEDKWVKDDATYQALKNDPDWFSVDVKYSRYNHDSAVATINSLPDTSAYLASAGGTNTIKFKGAAGSATDGGAINTLTAEEIAVATAKGWTVSLV